MVVVLALVNTGLLGLILRQPVDAATTVSLDFSTDTVKDSGTTTALWDTSAGTVTLPTNAALQFSGTISSDLNSSTVQPDVLLYGISFVSSSTGYVAGNNGYVWKTTDSGANWTALTRPETDKAIYDIDCTDATTCWVVNIDGDIYSTGNSGTNWSQQLTGDGTSLNTIDMVNSTFGWAGGGAFGEYLYKTTNGTDWGGSNNSGVEAIGDLTATSTNDMIYKGGSAGNIWYTHDGGTSFTVSTDPSDAAYVVGHTLAVSAGTSTIWTADIADDFVSPRVLKSADGGVTFASTTAATGVTFGATAVGMNDDGSGVVICAVACRYSTDGGVTWADSTISGSLGGAYDIEYVSASSFYIIESGETADSFGYSMDGGANIIMVSTVGLGSWPTASNIKAVAPSQTASSTNVAAFSANPEYRTTTNDFTNVSTPTGLGAVTVRDAECTDTNCVAGTSGGTYYSTNGGSSWTQATISGGGAMSRASNAVAMFGTATAYSITEGDGTNAIIYRSTDGGAVWTAVFTRSENASFTSVDCASATVCWALSLGGVISTSLPKDKFFIAAGAHPIIYGTTNGTDWSAQKDMFDESITAVQLTAISTTKAVVVGSGFSGDNSYRTTNGSTWTAFDIAGGATSLSTIECNGSGNCFAGGDSGYLVYTNNSGSTWTTQASAFGGSTVRDIEFGDDYRAFFSSSVRAIKKLSLAAGALTYQTSATVRTTALDATTDTITDATLTVTSTTPANTTITSYLSNDGGTTWTAVAAGATLTFPAGGSDLRYRADLATTDNTVTPTLDSVSIDFNTLVVTQNFTAGGLQLTPTDAFEHIQPDTISDGGTGFITFWTDYRDFGNAGAPNIYGQRVDSTGAALWTAGGVRIAATTSHQYGNRAVPDGSGGAFVTWYEDPTGAAPVKNIVAERVDNQGTVFWGPKTLLNNSSSAYGFGDTISDGAGGFLFSYNDFTDSSNLHVVRVNSVGTVLWNVTASTVTDTAYSPYGLRREPQSILSLDGAKVLIGFTTGSCSAGTTCSVYVQKLTLATGAVNYGTDGVMVDSYSAASSLSTRAHVVGLGPDANSGFIIAVIGRGDTDGDFLYNVGLNVMYGTPATMATTTIFSGVDSSIGGGMQAWDVGDGFTDSNGNLTFAYKAYDSGSTGVVLVNKIAPTGTVLWGTTFAGPSLSWTAVTLGSDGGFQPSIVSDGADGAFVSWLYPVTAFTTTGVRMQHLTAAGGRVWSTAQTDMGSGDYDGTGNLFYHQPIVVSSTSAYIVWDENNVFVQSVVESQVGASTPGTTPSSGGGFTEDGNTVPVNPAAGTPEARNTTTIRWKFTDRSNFETGFQLREEKPGDNNPRIIFTTEPIATSDLSYIDETGLTANTRYCSRVVRALNSKGLSAATQLSCAYTLAAAPKDAVVTIPSATTRLVAWKDGENATSTEYAIYEKESGQYVGPNGNLQKDAFWQTRDGWGGDEGMLVQGLDAKGIYTFQIISRNGEGKESLPVTAGDGVPSSEEEGGVPILLLKKSVAINPFGAALAAVSTAAGGASALLAVLFALAVMGFTVLHRRAGAGLCLAGVCRMVRSPAHSYVSDADNGPSRRAHGTLHRTGQVTGIAALIALLVQAAATSLLTFAPQFSFAAQTFTGDGNAVATGDTLTYQIHIGNDGNGSATSIALTDALPIGLAYQAGSLTVNGIKQSDACDNDAACFNAQGKTVSLAYPSIGPGDAIILTFNTTVTIAPGQGNTLVILRNSACATAKQLEKPACSNETMNPVAAAAVNANVNQPTNANQNANVPQVTNVNRALVNGNVNQPATTNANENVNAPTEEQPVPPEEGQPTPPEEKETQITVNGIEPSAETAITDPTPEIEGTSAPGSLVLITIDGRVAGVAYAGENGRFSFTPDRGLADGLHTITVSLDGVVFDTAQFVVDTAAPPAVSNLEILITKVDLSVSIRALFTDQSEGGREATIQVSGRTSPDTSLVRIRVESDPIEVTFTPPSTSWTREITGRFSPGEHLVTATAYDAAGNPSASASKTFVIPEPEPLETPLALLDDPQVEAIATISAPILPAIAALNVALATGIPTLFNFLGLLLTQPALLFARKEKKGYGTVFNSLSKLPVDLAIVRVRDENTKRILQTKVTDRLGRYVFFLNPGAFSFEVTKQGYVHPSKYLSGKTEDVAYTDLFAANSLSLSENTRLAKNVPLDPLEVQKTPAAIQRTLVLRRLQYAFALSGPVLSLIAFIITPTLLAGALLLIQILFFALFRRLAYKKPPKSFGIVRDEATGKPLPNAVIRIFETTYNKLLETQVTDARGRYAFLVGQSRYYVTAQAPGYQTVSTTPIDFSSVQKGGLVAKDIVLRQGMEQPPTAPTPPAPVSPPVTTTPIVPPVVPPAPPPMVPPISTVMTPPIMPPSAPPAWTPPPARPPQPPQTPPVQQ